MPEKQQAEISFNKIDGVEYRLKKIKFLKAGAEWADFPDLPHFQKTFGLTTKQLRTKKEKDETKDGYVNVK